MAVVSESDVRTERGQVPRWVTVAAWAAPLMVVAQFALLSGVPIAIALVGSVRRVRDRAVGVAASALAVSYLVPLVVWLTRPDGAESLSKDIHPGFVGLIVAVGAALLVTLHRARAR